MPVNSAELNVARCGLVRYRPPPRLGGRQVRLQAYPITFRGDGTVLRGATHGRYQRLGANVVCLGGWERNSGGGNMISTPRGSYTFMLRGGTMTIRRTSSGEVCPPWAATIPSPWDTTRAAASGK